MLERSNEQNELADALAKAQAAIRSAEKDRSNPHLRNRYATLESVIRATRPHLGANGLSLTCAPVVDADRAGVAWTLRHSSGQFESGVLLMPLGQARGVNPMQLVGSCASYAHRYVRMHLLACAAGDDVDGEVEQVRNPRPAQVEQPRNPVEDGPPVDTKSPAWRAWQARLAEAGLDYEHVAAWCEAHGRPRPSAMRVHQWRQLCQWLSNGGQPVVTAWSAEDAS
jgi:hypothetical protein